MCSTPKGKSTPVKPLHSITSISSALSTEQYRSMVERSNAADDRRQQRQQQRKAREAAPAPKSTPEQLPAAKTQRTEPHPLVRNLLDLLHTNLAPRQDG
ncbi:MAG: hypothetical protein V7629_14020 [Motiliproteus sp.]